MSISGAYRRQPIKPAVTFLAYTCNQSVSVDANLGAYRHQPVKSTVTMLVYT